ncbi:MAG: RNA polymerase sigma factor [Saprospiraceae bacterium]
MTEREIVDGCLAEDRFAQKELYERYKNAMFTISYRIAGDFGLAEEILQDAFIKIYRGLKGFRFESTLGAWIKIIVIRTAYSKIKKKVQFDPLEFAGTDSAIYISNKLDTEYLEKAIMDLPKGYRTVFWLVEVEGYAHREVSELLGISEGTSKSQLFYAKNKLREKLAQYR